MTAIAGAALVAAIALMPINASAQRGGHGGHFAGGFHRGPGGFHPGGGFGYFHRGFGGYFGGYGFGLYPWWGYGAYPWPYYYGYYGPSCRHVHVRYYRYGRPHWRWVYRCY